MSLASAFSISRRTGLGFVAIGLCWGTIAALLPQLKAGIGASDALFGMLMLGSAFGLATSMWLAPLADHRLGRHGLSLAVCLVALSFPLLALAPSPLAYGLVLVLLGATSGLADVLSNARVSELEARHKRTLMNVNHAIFSMAYAVAAIVAGLGREAGLAPFTILAMPALVCLALSPWVRLAPDTDESENGATGAQFPTFLVVLCGLIVLVSFGSEAAIESWSALYIERGLGGRAAEGALGPAMLGLTMAIGRTAGQVVADRWSDWRVLVGASILTASGVALAASAPVPWVAYTGFAFAGLGVSVIGPIGIAVAGRVVPPRHRTKAIARAAVLGFCGFFIAPVAMGMISETISLRAAFVAVAGFILLVLPLVAMVRARAT